MALAQFFFSFRPGVALVHLLPSILVPFAAIGFLRLNRRHSDFGWICYLTMIAAAIWVLIASLYIASAVEGLRQGLPERVDELWTHPFSLWAMLCAPAVPALLVVAFVTFTRKRRIWF